MKDNLILLFIALVFAGLCSLIGYTEGKKVGLGAGAAALATAKADLSVCLARRSDLDSVVTMQNKRVDGIVEESRKREVAAAASLAEARVESKSARAEAARIMATPRPSAQTECAAAEALIRKHLGE